MRQTGFASDQQDELRHVETPSLGLEGLSQTSRKEYAPWAGFSRPRQLAECRRRVGAAHDELFVTRGPAHARLPRMRLLTLYALVLLATFADGRPAMANSLPAVAADPFGYCARIGTIDTPAGGASPVPPSLEPRVRAALHLAADAPFKPSMFYWRCMQGAVYVCDTGANIPCETKANRAHHNAGAEEFCRTHTDLASVPAFATGHATVYAWSCVAGHAVRGKVLAPLDRRGYRSDFWHRIDAGVD